MSPAPAPLTCEMVVDCAEPVARIGRKGYIYCEAHGLARRRWEPTRRLKLWEIERLRTGRPLAGWSATRAETAAHDASTPSRNGDHPMTETTPAETPSPSYAETEAARQRTLTFPDGTPLYAGVRALGRGIPTTVHELIEALDGLTENYRDGEVFVRLDLESPSLTGGYHLYPVTIALDHEGDVILTVTDGERGNR